MCTKFQAFNLLWDPPCLLHWRCCRANACYLWRYLMPVCFGLRGQSLLKSNNCPCHLQPFSIEMATSMCRDCVTSLALLNVVLVLTIYLKWWHQHIIWNFPFLAIHAFVHIILCWKCAYFLTKFYVHGLIKVTCIENHGVHAHSVSDPCLPQNQTLGWSW